MVEEGEGERSTRGGIGGYGVVGSHPRYSTTSWNRWHVLALNEMPDLASRAKTSRRCSMCSCAELEKTMMPSKKTRPVVPGDLHVL